jgi:hypothetical protein
MAESLKYLIKAGPFFLIRQLNSTRVHVHTHASGCARFKVLTTFQRIIKFFNNICFYCLRALQRYEIPLFIQIIIAYNTSRGSFTQICNSDFIDMKIQKVSCENLLIAQLLLVSYKILQSTEHYDYSCQSFKLF